MVVLFMPACIRSSAGEWCQEGFGDDSVCQPPHCVVCMAAAGIVWTAGWMRGWVYYFADQCTLLMVGMF